MIYIVLFFVLLCLALSIRLMGGRQLCSPAVLLLAGMTIAILLAIVGRNSWNNIELGFDAALVLIVGVISYTVACILSHKHACRSQSHQPLKDQKTLVNHLMPMRKADKVKYIIILAIIIIAIILRVHETLRIANDYGLSKSDNYFVVAEVVRGSTTTLAEGGGSSQPISFGFWVNQADKVIAATGFASAVILAVRLNDSSNKKEAALPGATLLLSLIYYLIANTRTGIFWFVVTFFVAYYMANSTRSHTHFSIIKIMMVCGVALSCAVLFYAFGMMFGRGAGSGVIDYVSFYYGSEIPSLQALLRLIPLNQALPGSYTFNSLYSIIGKVFPLEGIPSYSLAWIDFGGLQSNVFSCFARYYLDFGYVGVIVLPFILGWCLTGLFERARRIPVSLTALVYCSLSPYIFDMVREEYFYSRLLSTTQIITLLLTAAVYVFLTWNLRDVFEKLLGKVQRGKLSNEEP